MDEDEHPGERSAGGGVIGLIILAALGWWIYNNWVKDDYSKPWFNGTVAARVCERPYSDESECFPATVRSNGEFIEQINFNNGGHIAGIDSECYEAASFYDFDQFCSMWDSSGSVWDVLP